MHVSKRKELFRDDTGVWRMVVERCGRSQFGVEQPGSRSVENDVRQIRAAWCGRTRPTSRAKAARWERARRLGAEVDESPAKLARVAAALEARRD